MISRCDMTGYVMDITCYFSPSARPSLSPDLQVGSLGVGGGGGGGGGGGNSVLLD